MEHYPQTPKEVERRMALTALGAILAFIGGTVTVAYAFLLSGSGWVFFGLVLVLGMVGQVQGAKLKYALRPLFIGLVALLGSLIVLALIYFTRSAWWLFALIFVAGLCDEVV